MSRKATHSVGLIVLVAACTSSAAPVSDASVDAMSSDAAVDASPPPRCEPPAVPPATCNLHAELCSRRYDEVAYATSHNAMSNLEERWLAPNQSFRVTRQLEDGVRALMLDTHYFRDEPVLCHGICTAGRKPLAEGLFEIAEFLRCHPAEVVSIIFETYISPEDTRAAFVESGLDAYLHVQAPDAPWPTLGEMIASGERLVVFTDRDGDAWPGYHDIWAWAFETPFAAETPADLRCELGRGAMGSDLFILNHFLTAPLAAPSLAEMVNYDP
ncbi:MAG: hypothetical protein GXP55_15235, partial [Deltaproteobacteria bacterium]|nr:hypothetical protein [Deltaproteobacteria bacterium]